MTTKGIQTEIDAAFLYHKLAEHEEDKTIARVFEQMAAIEKSHAEAFAAKEQIALWQSIRLRLCAWGFNGYRKGYIKGYYCYKREK